MFQLFNEPVEISVNRLKTETFTTLLCGGIVNPYGPTLSATVLIEEESPDHFCIADVMLNPFSQQARRIGRAAIEETWDPVVDYETIIKITEGGCPTLVLPSSILSLSDTLEVHRRWLSNFPEWAQTWEQVRMHPFDPWNRVSKEIEAAFETIGRQRRAISGEESHGDLEAAEFATFVLSKEHTIPELQAFNFAWEGSIRFQLEQGSPALAATALPFKEFCQWLSLIAKSCRLPEATDDEPSN